jgi:hypothetical protein
MAVVRVSLPDTFAVASRSVGQRAARVERGLEASVLAVERANKLGILILTQ